MKVASSSHCRAGEPATLAPGTWRPRGLMEAEVKRVGSGRDAGLRMLRSGKLFGFPAGSSQIFFPQNIRTHFCVVPAGLLRWRLHWRRRWLRLRLRLPVRLRVRLRLLLWRGLRPRLRQGLRLRRNAAAPPGVMKVEAFGVTLCGRGKCTGGLGPEASHQGRPDILEIDPSNRGVPGAYDPGDLTTGIDIQVVVDEGFGGSMGSAGSSGVTTLTGKRGAEGCPEGGRPEGGRPDGPDGGVRGILKSKTGAPGRRGGRAGDRGAADPAGRPDIPKPVMLSLEVNLSE